MDADYLSYLHSILHWAEDSGTEAVPVGCDDGWGWKATFFSYHPRGTFAYLVAKAERDWEMPSVPALTSCIEEVVVLVYATLVRFIMPGPFLIT